MSRKILFIVCIIVLAFSITDQSLWIDEASTAYFASINDLSLLYQQLIDTKTSETQMPGYIFFMNLWSKIGGLSEWFLRASNLLFIAIYFISIIQLPIKSKLKLIISIIIMLNPFIWYNMNEARSTIALFTSSGLVINGFLLHMHNHKKWGRFWIFCGLIIGTYLNMLFLFSFPIYIVFWYFECRRVKISFSKFFRDEKYYILLTFILIFPVIFYYIYTVLTGAGGMRAEPGIKNILFYLYEILGFTGLGPPRNILREHLSSIFEIKYIIPVILFNIFLVFLFVLLFIKKIHWPVKANVYLFSFGFGIAIFFAITWIVKFQFWGRHLAFLLPFFLLILAFFIYKNLDEIRGRLILGLLLIFWLYSIYNIRFNNSYSKDDYRGAADYILENTNNSQDIFWAGSYKAAYYYGLLDKDQNIIVNLPVKRIITNISNCTKLPPMHTHSILVVFNKYDLYDKKKGIRHALTKSRFKLLKRQKDFCIYLYE